MPTPPKQITDENKPQELALRRATRSSTKGAKTTSAASKEPVTNGARKRKKSGEPAEQSSKCKQKNTKAKAPAEDHNQNETSGEATGPMEQGTHQPTTAVKVPVRQAPPRAALSLDSEDEGEDGRVGNDGASHVESDEGATDLPTALDLIDEYPTPVETPIVGVRNDGADTSTNDVAKSRMTGGKRANKIINEVPTISTSIGENIGENNAPTVPTQFTTIQPIYLPLHNIALPPISNVVSPPGLGVVPPAWPAITDLVVGRDSRYQQSDQTPEVQACLKAAVRRANANLVFLDGFPDALHKARWLGDALISGRWSTFRQGVIDAARALVASSESSYGIHASDGFNRAQTAQNLLSNDAYHFGKTTAGAVDLATPYQHPEVFATLAYYFKGREAVGVIYKENIPEGIYGAEIPDAMVALTTTAIQVALEELVAGRPSVFLEKACREKYRIHLSTIQAVKASTHGDHKHARMMSNIHHGTMNHLENGRPVLGPTNAVTVDLGRMAV